MANMKNMFNSVIFALYFFCSAICTVAFHSKISSNKLGCVDMSMSLQRKFDWRQNIASLAILTTLVGNPVLQQLPAYGADTVKISVQSSQQQVSKSIQPAKSSVVQPVKVKLAEEKALDAAVAKKSGDQNKITALNGAINTAKQSLNNARGEIKKLESQISVLDTKLQNNKLDKDLKDSVIEDKERLVKPLNEVCM